MSISAKERREIPDNKMGDPAHDKFPLDTEEHIRSAANLIGHAKDKKQVAENILRRAKEEGVSTDSMHKVKQVAGVEEQVPPMSDGTSLGNAPPRLMAPYYDEAGEELAQRLATASSQASSCCSVSPTTEDTIISQLDRMMARSDSKRDPFVFAQKIVKEISAQVEKDSKPPTGNQNCELCTWCAEARYRGINALPRPIYSPRDPGLPGNGHHNGEDIVMNPIKESFKSQRDVIERVRTAVDSRWYVHVNWKDSTGGHEFLVVNIDDYAYIMDAQAGLLKEIDEADSTDSYFRDINFKNSYMVRLDTRKFNAELFNDVNNPDNVLPWDPKKDVPYMRDRGMIGDVSSQYTMRPATDSDLDFVYQSELETVGENKDDPKVQKYIRKDAKDSLGHTKIIVMDDTDIGVYQAYETNYYGLREGTRDWWYLAHIYIKPEYRNLGIGSDIIKKDIKTHDKILLQVMKSNTLAKKLYESLGFVVDMENDHGGLVMRLDKSKPVQEGVINNLRDMTLLPVKDFKYNKVFYGDPIDGGSVRKLDGKPLFVTPHAGIASIFVGRRNIFHKLSEMGYPQVNLGYDEWGSAPDKPLTDVHVYVRNAPDLKPFKIEFDGYLHTIDCSKLKDNIYHYPWMRSTEHEVLIAKVPEVKIDKVQKMHITYHVRGIKGNSVQESAIQEAACAAYSASMHNAMSQLRNLIGSRYDIMGGGMGVNRYTIKSKLNPKLAFQVDLNGANLEVMPVINDIPKYEKKRRGIAFMRAADAIARYIDEIEAEQSKTVQEGAFQDLKNGVNPFSDDMVFHVTADKHVDGQVWQPRVPEYLDPYNPEETGFEDNTTPRICFSTSIEGCLNGITVNLPRQNPDQFDKLYVYIPEKPWKKYKHKTNKELVKEKLVYDANVSREVWIMEPVRMKLYGVIRVDQVSNVKRKSVVPTSKGVKGDRNYFTYKWHWVVKPKVLAKATKFDYSPERVIDDLCIDLKKFKYGLIKDGKLNTNASDADYEKYWKFHSGQEVDEAGGGNCWDMVEYEAGYLEAFGVAYKKYFLSFTTTKNQPLRTHTICVVPLNGKYVYIEQAFKRVIDEWGSDRQKTFDKLNDIFDYVAECDAECEGQPINFGVWDYTNTKIDYGVSSKDFMRTIMSGKMIYDGEADQPKSVKESFEIPARFSGYHYREGYYV